MTTMSSSSGTVAAARIRCSSCSRVTSGPESEAHFRPDAEPFLLIQYPGERRDLAQRARAFAAIRQDWKDLGERACEDRVPCARVFRRGRCRRAATWQRAGASSRAGMAPCEVARLPQRAGRCFVPRPTRGGSRRSRPDDTRGQPSQEGAVSRPRHRACRTGRRTRRGVTGSMGPQSSRARCRRSSRDRAPVSPGSRLPRPAAGLDVQPVESVTAIKVLAARRGASCSPA